MRKHPRQWPLNKPASTTASTHLILLEHLALPERFHRIDLARIDLLHESHLSERALSDDLYRSKVIQAQSRTSQTQEATLASSERR